MDQFRQDNERSRSHLGIDFYDESIDLVKNIQEIDLNDNILTNIHSITVNTNPTLDTEVAHKNWVNDSIGSGRILRFNQTLENYLKVCVGNDTYILTKHNKIQLTDTRVTKFGNDGD